MAGTYIRDTEGMHSNGHCLDLIPYGQLAERGFGSSGLGGRRGLGAEVPS